MVITPSDNLHSSLLALLLDGRWAVAIERCREAGASLEEAKELLGAMLAEARAEYRAAQRAGAWAPASAEQAEGNDASRKSEAGGKPEQQPPLEPPPWLLDAYVEALVHPYTGEGLSAEAKRRAGGLPEALRLEAFCRARRSCTTALMRWRSRSMTASSASARSCRRSSASYRALARPPMPR